MITHTDVVVIGGGPGGAVVASLVSRAGHAVRLFDRQEFPRFQIGESLVPAVNLTLGRVGVLERMDERRFVRKHGVQFFSPSGEPTRPFYFADVEDPRMHNTWQVLRSRFDQMMIDHAAAEGAAVMTGAEVVDVLSETDAAGERVTGVQVRHADGTEETVRCRVVVDASGQNSLVARRYGDRQHIEGLQNTAVYAHYRDVVRDQGKDAGSTLIYRLPGKAWIWFIPLRDTVSIGLVAPAASISGYGNSLNEILDRAIAQSPPLAERLVDATRTTAVRAARDYSYRARNDGGRGWMLVGDALGFMDPIYSTGLLLAMFSAEIAADAIVHQLADGGPVPDTGRAEGLTAALRPAIEGDSFAGYSKDYQVAFDQLKTLVQAFYHDDFHFGQLARDPLLRQGLVDLLTGVVGTDAASAVTRSIQAVFAGETVI